METVDLECIKVPYFMDTLPLHTFRESKTTSPIPL